MRKASRRFTMPGSLWILLPVVLLLFPLAASAVNLASVTVNPRTVVGGSSFEVTVALDSPLPAGANFVGVTTDQPSVVTGVYSGWPTGGTTSFGLIFTTGHVEETTQATITATYGGGSKSATLTVTPREPVRGTAGDLWADVILGHPDFGEITNNMVTGRALFLPGGVTVDRTTRPNRVYVYDAGNSRVLGLDHLGVCAGGTNIGQNCTANSDCPGSTCPIQEARGADLVLGQPSFNRSACNGDGAFQRYPQRAPASAATLCTMPENQISIGEWVPGGNMVVDGAGNLYVTDFENHRVLRYNSPFTTDAIADDVWGQADFAGNECNRGRGQGAPDNQSLCFGGGSYGFTAGVAIDSGGNLWVADNSNNRVLKFSFDPATGSPRHVADLVLGQTGFSTSAKGTALNQMWGPAAVRVDGTGKVYVADSQNGRVLIFAPPVTLGKTATKLNYAFNAPAGNSGTPTGLEFDDAGGLWVNDSYNNQLLLFVGGVFQKVLFKDLPFSNLSGVTGDGPDFFSEGEGTYYPSWGMVHSTGSIGIDSDGNIFASGVSDDVWRFPAPIPMPTRLIAHSADARLFRPYQYWCTNEVGLAGFNGISGVAVAGTQLIVSDHARLLYWDNPPNLTNGQAAAGYTGVSSDHYQPNWEWFARIREDRNSHLFAVWRDTIRVYSLPLSQGASPIATLGPTLPVLGGGSVTLNPYSLQTAGVAPVAAGDKVWLSDPWTSRVFRIRDALTAPVVDIILGQNNATATSCNQGSANPSRTSLCSPGALRLDPQGNLYVSDSAQEGSGNFRLLEYDAGLFPDSPSAVLFAIPASRVFGMGGSFTAKQSGQEFTAATLEPAFTANGQMVVSQNGYWLPRFPYVYTNPLISQHPDTFLNDFQSWASTATFDSSDNLYLVDGDRSRVLIYLNPLSSPPPGSSTLTVTKTGGGTGTVKSAPFGIDCGTDCSQAYIDGAIVAFSLVPGTGSVFAGWTGDADCSDGVVTMNNNKTCTARFELMPDLIVYALTAPAGALAGSTITVTDTTKNSGTGPAGASTTRFYFSANATWDASDTEIGSRGIPSLAAGLSSSGSTDVAIPAGKATGTYYIIAKADADGTLTESSETDNTKYATIRISPPDLVVSAISVPTTGGAGLTIVATNTTKNQTNTGPAPTSITKFYLSSNTTWDTGDTPFAASQTVGALAPGVSEPHSTSLTIPSTFTGVGTWYVIAKADADNLIQETLETNNTAYDSIVIGPDLIVSALTVPATGGAGLPITITDTTRNQGAGSAAASTTRFYLSTNTTYGTGDVLLGTRNIGTLAPNAVSTVQTTLTIPAGTAVGSYYLLAIADGPATVSETIETNNTTYAIIKLSPDLTVSALTAPASAAAGANINVTDTTRNSGQGVAGPATTKFYLSTNTTWDAADTPLGPGRNIGNLISGAVSTATTTLTLPGVAPGPYYILAKADAAGAVAETSETNNVTSKAITVTP